MGKQDYSKAQFIEVHLIQWYEGHTDKETW